MSGSTGVGVGLSISGVHWWMERWMHVIQSNVIIRVIQAEERIHNRCMELTAMEHIDPQSYSSSHHGCIQHQVEVPMQDQKLNKDHHAA